MAGLIRVCAPSGRRRRAGLSFRHGWAPLNGSQVDEAQFLAILEDPELDIEFAADAEAPEWHPYPERTQAIAVLRDHIAYDRDHGRPHDRLTGLAPVDTEFRSADGGDGRAEDGAPSSGAPEPKGEVAKSASPVDPDGGETAATAVSRKAREGTSGETTAQDAAPGGEPQPEESPRPPVVASDPAPAGEAQASPTGEAAMPKSAAARRRKA